MFIFLYKGRAMSISVMHVVETFKAVKVTPALPQ